MVHSEEYLNKYVVSIASFSTPACPDCSQKLLFFACFAFYFFIHFPRGSADPICPYVRTPMYTRLVEMCRDMEIAVTFRRRWWKGTLQNFELMMPATC